MTLFRRLWFLLAGCPICGRGYRDLEGKRRAHLSFCRWSRR